MSATSYILGITGGSASGKTLFLKRLMEMLPKEQVCLISQDNYYRALHEQPKDLNGVENFDTPNSIDHERYSSHIRSLAAGESVTVEEYTFNNPNLIPDKITYKPAPLIIVEGIFVFTFADVAGLLDLKVFIDAKEVIKVRRRIARDRDERGYDLEDVLYRYEHHVMPTYEKYIEPQKHVADLIIPNNVNFEKGLTVVAAFLKDKIREKQEAWERKPATAEQNA
ncbi:MAG: uridine-cytidine kinase [Bacteroidota bacterium]